MIDLRTVAPLDMAPILESVHKTSRLLIAHEAVVPFGIGAEIAATVARDGVLGSRRADRAHRRRGDAPALRARPRTRVAARPRRHRRRDPPPRRRSDSDSSAAAGAPRSLWRAADRHFEERRSQWQTAAVEFDPKADLHEYLQSGREVMLWKLDGLSEYDTRRPLVPTGTNLLGLVRHVASIETGYFGSVFGRPFPEPLPWMAGWRAER